MTPSTTPETELTPELIDRVMKLSPENRAKLAELLDEADGPPAMSEDEVRELIRRRAEQAARPDCPTLSKEEALAAVRQAMRAYGVEL